MALDDERGPAARRARAAWPRQRRPRAEAPAARRRSPSSSRTSQGVDALHSPATAVVDFRPWRETFAQGRRSGGRRGRHRLRGRERRPARQPALRPPQPRREPRALRGLLRRRWSDRLAVAAGGDPDPRIVPFRGAWLRLRPERRDLVRALVYPVPDPDAPVPRRPLHPRHRRRGADRPDRAAGRRRAPTASAASSAADLRDTLAWAGTYRMARRWWRTGLTELRHAAERRALVRDGARYIPELTPDDVLPGPAGVRAQALGRDGSLVDDFVVSETERALACPQRPLPRRHVLARARAADRGPRHMKVLVTGHDGYIGTVLTPLLLEAGHEPLGLDTSLFANHAFGEIAGGPRARGRHPRRHRRGARRLRRRHPPRRALQRPARQPRPGDHLRGQPPRERRAGAAPPARPASRASSTRARAAPTAPAPATHRSTRARTSTPSRPTASRRCSPSATSPRSPPPPSPPSSSATPPPTASRPACAATSWSTTSSPTPTRPARCGCSPTARRGARSPTSRTSRAPSSPRSRRPQRPSTTRPSTSAATRTTTRSATSPGWSSRPPAPA